MIRHVVVYAALLALLVGGFAFFQSSVFRLRTIEIQGIEHLSAEEVKMILGVEGGQHLYSFTIGDLHHRLMSDPRVAEASLQRNLPGQLVVEILEKPPVAVVISGGVFAQVDERGTVISVHERWPEVDLPVIKPISPDSLALGEKVSGDSDVDKLLRCSVSLNEVRSEISEIKLSDGYFEMYTSDAAVILYPREAEAMREAASVLKEILREENIGGYLVDLRVPGRPVLRQLDD